MQSLQYSTSKQSQQDAQILVTRSHECYTAHFFLVLLAHQILAGLKDCFIKTVTAPSLSQVYDHRNAGCKPAPSPTGSVGVLTMQQGLPGGPAWVLLVAVAGADPAVALAGPAVAGDAPAVTGAG